jgi:hypothetical protein
MNIGYGLYDPNGDDIIDRGQFCCSNEVEDEILEKIDNIAAKSEQQNNPLTN